LKINNEALNTNKILGISIVDLGLAFTTCIVIVHLWSIFNLLETIPSWIFRLTTWEIIGGISYTQVLAFFESMLLFGILLFIGILIPKRFYADKFVVHSALFALLISIWAVIIQYNYGVIRTLGGKKLLILLFLILLSASLILIIVNRIKKIDLLIYSVVQKMAVLGIVYLIIDVLAIFIVIARNL